MYQDFGAGLRTENPPGVAPADAAGQVADLISRYPNLSEIELARLINLYRGLPALEMALMISDERLAQRLDRFFSDHRRDLRRPVREYAALLVIAAAGLATAVWAAMLGRM